MVPRLENYPDRVAELFAGKTIFITGGTGLIGKVLIEKLLRSCPKLKKIYVLIRFKYNYKPRGRLNEIFRSPLFDHVKSLHGDQVVEKVEFLTGDLEDIDLSFIDGSQEKVITEVDFIYHCASSMRFDEPLKRAVLTNVRGTREVLKLAKRCQKLKAFCHVSTAFCHPNEGILEEKSYLLPADPHDVIDLCESKSDEAVDKMASTLLKGCPNTYVFTKALSEALAVEEKNLPIIIARPALVTPIYYEPLPGWSDSMDGFTGLIIGTGKGIVRTIYCKDDNYANFVPVDVVVNGLISAVFGFLTTHNKKIYNFASSDKQMTTWKEVLDIERRIAQTEMPLNDCLWYPDGSVKNSRMVHLFYFYLFQWLPAIFTDLFLVLLGYKPKLMEVQRRIYHGYQVLEYYAHKSWQFKTDNVKSLKTLLNPREKDIYKTECNISDYHSYFLECTHAARLYILKQSDDTIRSAKWRIKVIWCLDMLVKPLLAFALLYCLWRTFFTRLAVHYERI